MSANHDHRAQCDIEVDVGIIGAGPAGLYAAYCVGFRGLSCALLDASDHVGGQVSALYPEKPIYDIPGHVAIRGRELVDRLSEQVATFDPHLVLGHAATTLTPADGNGWLVGLDDGRVVRARAVVLAAGLGRAIARTVPCLRPYEGRGVAHHVPRLEDHRGRDVVIAGGGDSAVDWALALGPLARSVTLVHRRSMLRAQDHSVRQLGASGVRVLLDSQVTACFGERWLERVQVLTSAAGADAEQTLPAQTLVAALGFMTDLGPISHWGLQVRNRQIVVDREMRTNLPGVFAISDVCSEENRVPLLSVSFGEAATAAAHAAVHARPGARLRPEHSTDRVPAGAA